MGKDGANGAKTSGRRSGKLAWDWKARHVLTDRFVLADLARLMALAGGGLTLLLSGLMLVQGDADAAGRVAVFGLVMTGAVTLLLLCVMLVVGGRFRYRFEIDDKGVTFIMLSSFVKTGNRLAIALGALARSPGTVGAGLLARSEERNRIDFKDLSKARHYPEAKVIFLRGRFNPKPIRLYCPPELYAEAAERIRLGLAAAEASREREEAISGPSPVPRQIKATLTALAASGLILAAPLDAPAVLALALAVLAAGAIWVAPAARFCGVMLCLGSLSVGLFLAKLLTAVNVTTTEEQFRAFAASKGVRLNEAAGLDNAILGNYAPYETFDPERWVLFGLAVLGVLVLAALGLAAYRGGFDRNRPGMAA